jgi:signal transduction histidine kinase
MTGQKQRLAVVFGALVGSAAFLVLTSRGETPSATETPIAVQAMQLAVALLYVVMGLMIWSRHPGRLVGRLVSAAGLLLLAGYSWVQVDNAAVFTAGMVAQSLFLALLAHAAVAYPSGRLSSVLDRVTVAAAYTVILGENLFADLSNCAGCPRNILLLPLGKDTLERAIVVQRVVTLLAIALFMITLARHLRQGSAAARRALAPVVAAALLLAAAHAGLLLVALGASLGPDWVWWLGTLGTAAALPVAYLGARLRSRWAGVGLGRLVVELGSGPPPGQLRAALARALGDPTVEVALWARDREHYVDSDGRPLRLPEQDESRAVTMMERAGEPVGALVHDPALLEEPGMVHAVCAAVGLAVENERLQAEVLARLEEVRASRKRIVQAADDARRRVERNLHDGAQQRLVTLALALGMARNRLRSDPQPGVDTLLAEAAEELRLALGELRELGGGLHPPILSDEGLEAALDSLAERSPIPVDLSVNVAKRPPPPVEAAAYFVVSEALANASKHAGASRISVRAAQHDGRLSVQIADDGVGGAAIRPRSGLEGLSDRVEALGGRLEVVSPPGGGTSLIAEIPCG